jgi:hypothetical protein
MHRKLLAFAFPAGFIAAAAFLVSTPVSSGDVDLEDCVYDPEETCCQCVHGEGICYEVDDRGGTDYCSSEVCPFEDPPCLNKTT